MDQKSSGRGSSLYNEKPDAPILQLRQLEPNPNAAKFYHTFTNQKPKESMELIDQELIDEFISHNEALLSNSLRNGSLSPEVLSLIRSTQNFSRSGPMSIPILIPQPFSATVSESQESKDALPTLGLVRA
jgi:hypothetical protein